ncbi:MAG: carbohydrate-binding domain-containing protein, partial [Gemmatimonas sp.]
DAKFTVSVDGQQVGGTYTATASHAAGQVQDVAVAGTFSSGPHTVDVHFVNDAWGGTAATDRNLYVQGIALNGEAMLGSAGTNNAANGAHTTDGSAPMDINGTVSFHTTGTATPIDPTTPPPPPTTTSSLSTLVFHVSEDAWNGNAQFKVLVDGQQVGGLQTATASHANGQWQDVTLTGDFGSLGPNKVSVEFVNDAWGGTAQTDRNLYVDYVDVNGMRFQGETAANNATNGHASADPYAAVMEINGTADFAINHTAAPGLLHA